MFCVQANIVGQCRLCWESRESFHVFQVMHWVSQ